MQATSHVIPRHGRLWLMFGLAVSGAFFILGFFGREVYRQAPPIPGEVRTTDGRVLMTRDDILTGQTVWQSTGGQQLGSILGSRRISGTGLDCRLAAPRSDDAARSMERGHLRCVVRTTR